MERTTKDKVIAKIKSTPKGKLFIISDIAKITDIYATAVDYDAKAEVS